MVGKHKYGFDSIMFNHQVLNNIPISTAIEIWLNTLKTDETKRKYNRAMKRIFSLHPLSELLEKNCSISSLSKYDGSIGIYDLIKELKAPKSVIKTCQNVFSKFCDYLRINTLGIIDPEETPKQKEEYYTTAEIYDEIDWKRFIFSLPEPFNLIAEMAFFAAEKCEYRLRLVNSKKNILSLDCSQINFDNKTISFKAEQSYHVVDILNSPLCIPFHEKPEFFDKLKSYLGKRKGTVFLSSRGKPLFSIQVQKAFKIASQSQPYEITPVMLGWAGVLSYKKAKEKKFGGS